MENTHSVRGSARAGLGVVWASWLLALVGCQGEETVIPPEPDPSAWAALSDTDGDVTFVDRGPEADATPGSDASVSGLCSGQGPATTWEVTNRFGAPVTLWWVDFGCVERRYADVLPGATYRQGTFVTHVWRVRATNDNHLIVEVVLDESPLQTTEVR